MERNDRLSSSLQDATNRSVKIDAKAKRTRFTSETAMDANAKKYAGVLKKPRTATVRVEADIIDLVKVLPTSERVHIISEAIRMALKSH